MTHFLLDMAVRLGVWGGGAVLFLWIAFLKRRSRSWCLGALRAASGCLLLAALWPRAWGLFSGGRTPVAVVWDDSASMAAPYNDTKETRWDRARRAWIQAGGDMLGPARLFLLNGGLKEISSQEVVLSSPTGRHSPLADVALLKDRAPECRGVIVFSDGRSEGVDRLGAAVAGAGFSVLAVGVGREMNSLDVEVQDARPSRLVFSGEETDVSVRLACRGAVEVQAEVSLWEGDRRWVREKWVVSAARPREGVLRFRPTGLGPRRFRVEVTPLEGETNTTNNRRDFFVDVARARLRVLYLCGRPGPHYGFLRSQLKLDPAVELVSFVILRDPEDAIGVSESDLSLIPFPTPETLIRQLKTFDVVLLENFPLRSFGLGPHFAEALVSYVRRGGGLLVSGEGAYWRQGGPARGTPLETFLPSTDSLPGVPGRWVADVRWPAHPLMAVASTENESARHWRESPPLESNGDMPWPVLAEGTPLLRAPGDTPWLSSRFYFRGRVLLLAGLTDWRWALASGPQGPWFYQRFWENIVRWLGQSADQKSLRLLSSGGEVPAGESWTLTARYTGEHPPTSITVNARNEKGERVTARLVSSGPGDYAGPILLSTPGIYELETRVGNASDRQMIEVSSGWDEALDTRPQFTSMERLAGATGGTAISVESFSLWTLRQWRRSLVSAAAPHAPRSPFLLLAVVVMLAAEWGRRRRWGES